MTLRYLSGSNGFIPEATGQVIAFARKPEQFPINRYAQYISSPKTVGVYANLARDQFVRIVSDEEFAWEDGANRPQGWYNQMRFEWIEFRTTRRNYGYTLGWQALEQAEGSWKASAAHRTMAVSQAMTNRTNRTIGLLENAANWGANTDDAKTLNGNTLGGWNIGSDDPTSAEYLNIGKSLLEAARRITLQTNANVNISDLRLVISPGLAIAMSTTGEIRNYLRESPFAMSQVRGDTPNMNSLYGLPSRYMGIEIVVENSPIVTSRPLVSGVEATTTRTFIKDDDNAILLSRPGGIDGEYGAPSFSTVQIYYWKDLLSVHEFDEAQHERTNGNVTENFKEVLAANVSGFLITDTITATA